MKNLSAFLTSLAISEGTQDVPGGDSGYRVIVGATQRQPILFGSYHDHPRIAVRVRKDKPSTPFDEEIISTAAGRYQILARIFDAYREPLRLQDFGPHAQDAIAVRLIHECRALDDIEAGRFEMAITKCRSRWASLPGAGYNQHENSMAMLSTAYINAGGMLA